MREICFRAKIKAKNLCQKMALTNKPLKEGDWAYGEVHLQSPVPHIHVGPGYRYPIDVETVGQYTGLKDCSGREVYEGDIIRSYDSTGAAIEHIVGYREGSVVVRLCDFPRASFILTQSWLDEFEKYIIGNIHDDKII